jgi:hypothetical protein
MIDTSATGEHELRAGLRLAVMGARTIGRTLRRIGSR